MRCFGFVRYCEDLHDVTVKEIRSSHYGGFAAILGTLEGVTNSLQCLGYEIEEHAAHLPSSQLIVGLVQPERYIKP